MLPGAAEEELPLMLPFVPNGRSTSPTTSRVTDTCGTGTGCTLNQQARDLSAQASQQFDDAPAALQAGDFAGYGLKTEALQKRLRGLQALQ